MHRYLQVLAVLPLDGTQHGLVVVCAPLALKIAMRARFKTSTTTLHPFSLFLSSFLIPPRPILLFLVAHRTFFPQAHSPLCASSRPPYYPVSSSYLF